MYTPHFLRPRAAPARAPPTVLVHDGVRQRKERGVTQLFQALGADQVEIDWSQHHQDEPGTQEKYTARQTQVAKKEAGKEEATNLSQLLMSGQKDEGYPQQRKKA